MRVFKCALKLIFKRPVYFLVYGLWLSLMGVFMASSLTFAGEQGEYEPYEVEYAVIDRDASGISAGIGEFLQTQGTQVPIEDSDRALQDLVAKGGASYVLIIPEGYGERFLSAARAGEELPEMECVYSYYSAEGALADAALADYLGALRTYALTMPDAEQDQLCERALAAAEVAAPVESIAISDQPAENERFLFYLQFDMYVYVAGIVVCVGLMLVTMNRADVRRRNLASPVSYRSRSAQMLLACLVVTVVYWLMTFALGVACFPQSFAAISMQGKLMMGLVALVFACVPLSLAFLMGQLGVGETAMNAIGNITGLVMSFLGGTWVPMDIASPEVATLARFLPGYWYTDALNRASSLTGLDPAALGAIGVDIGVLLLFVAAISGAALVIGRMRAQTSSAGGNAAAEAPAM